jgi:2',3'-cyclic-nucleotide 2'-phosphodiesterase / 3'-nucleotidase / 5'-nucleotidase
VTPDSTTAYVCLQENNAIAEIDIASATVTKLWPLGYKNHNAKKNALDPSNRDDGIEIDNWPVTGMYQPDAIAVVQDKHGKNYIISANEGDARDYDGFSEEVRVADLADIDEGFQLTKSLAKLAEQEDLGRLRTTSYPPSGKQVKIVGGEEVAIFNTIYAYGARSFSVWKSNGAQVFDSGDAFEQITAEVLGDNFNSNNNESDSGDSRSDDKGPEPEGLTIGVIDGKTYAFIGLERVGGIMIYDVTDPKKPVFCSYARDLRNFDIEFDEDHLSNFDAVGDLGPEGLEFIPAGSVNPDSPNMVVVANEVSGTITVYEVVDL